VNNKNQSNAADDALGAMLVHVASSASLLSAVGVPSRAIAQAMLGAAVSFGRQAVGPADMAGALRQVADDIDRQEALRGSMTAGSA
jgi:hypothetical protein